MVAESGFDCIRYFDNSVIPMGVRDLSEFRKAQIATKEGKVAFDFLQKYMVLNRCDMFFADKLILIEGSVERLVLPRMIDEVAKELAHKYLSVIEVGGAYAHLFRGIVEFLNVQTLVITDIDSVDPADKRKAAAVAPGLVSSNQSLIKWLPAMSSIDDLLAATPESKVNDRVSVAYQVPEIGKTKTGRSFEEAFILANASVLESTVTYASEKAFQAADGTRLAAAVIESDSFELAKAIDKKTDFAFDILQMTDWAVPRYIKEGLEWLNKTP
jgi:putative ATP-dependent endonuclease of the OLD family